MADSSVLVPGTGGITLMDSNGNDLGYPIMMELGVRTGGLLGRSAADLVSLLSMDHRPGQIAPAKTSLVPGLAIRPGHTLEVAYNQIPANINRFLYDWRADMRYSAQQLLTYLQERQPPNGRWNLIGHSQGGLLIVLASKLLASPNDFAKLVRSIVLVGAPVGGTINAANAVVAGDLMGAAAESAFQQIVRTWPSLYQMMPTWRAVVSSDVAPTPSQLLDLATWTGLVGVTADMLQRARDAMNLLANPLLNLGGDIKLSVIMARTRPTGKDLEWTGTVLSAQSLSFELGDTLVPFDTTLAHFGPAGGPYIKKMIGPIREHTYLCDDPTVVNTIMQGIA